MSMKVTTPFTAYSYVNAGEGNNFVSITGGNNTISAGSGDDTIYSDGVSSIDAGDGANLITTDESSTIKTGKDADTIYGDSYNNSIDAGDGDNFVSLSGNGGNDNDTIFAGSGDDTIYGYGNSYVNAGEGNNFVSINGGNNTISAGSGDDTIYDDGYSSIDVGDGANFVSLSGYSNTITTGKDADTIYSYGERNIINAGDGNNSILLSGSPRSTINVGAGDDSIVVYGEYVTINAEDGNNFIDVEGEGSNSIIAGIGNDTIYTRGKSNYINASSGANFISLSGDGANISEYPNTIVTGEGNDTIQADGMNLIDAGTGENFISLNGSGSTVTTGDDDKADTINGDGNSNVIDIGDGANFVSLSGIYNTISAGGGDDTIYSGDYSSIDAGDGANFVSINGGDNTISAGSGDDTIYGGGPSTIDAGGGADLISLYADSRVVEYSGAFINTGAGNDTVDISVEDHQTLFNATVNVSSGDDDDVINVINLNSAEGSAAHTSKVTVDGGTGNDTVNFGAMYQSTVEIYGDEGTDQINLTGEIDTSYLTINSGVGQDTVAIKKSYLSTVNVEGGDGNDEINFVNDDDQSMVIQDSNVTLNLGKGNDTLNISSQNIIAVYNSTVEVEGGAGADKINSGGGISSGTINIDGGADSDEINLLGGVNNALSESNATVTGGDGNDTIKIMHGDTEYHNSIWNSTLEVDGGKGIDNIKFDGVIAESSATINGGDDDDTITLIDETDSALYKATVEVYGGAGSDKINIVGEIGESQLIIDGGNDADTVSIDNILDSSNVTIKAGAGDNISITSGIANYLFDDIEAVTINGATFKSSAANTSADIQTNSTEMVLLNDWSGTVELSEGQTFIDYTGTDIGEVGTYEVVNGKLNIPWATVINAEGTSSVSADVDIANGTNGNDTIKVSHMQNVSRTINGLGGNDEINIVGNDFGIVSATVNVDAGAADDLINVEGGGGGIYYDANVTLNGDAGNDTINIGGTEVDGSMYSRYLIDGGNDNDLIKVSGMTAIGGGSTVTATGGTGDDTVEVIANYDGIGGSNVLLDVGEGNDLIKIVGNEGNGIDHSSVTINTGEGNDTINISAGILGLASATVNVDAGAGDDLISISGDSIGVSFAERYEYDPETDAELTLASASSLSINGGAGADTIFVNGIDSVSTLTINGDEGADLISIGTIEAGAQNISIVAGADDNISVTSGVAKYLFDGTDAVTINGAIFKSSAANTSADIQTNSTEMVLLNDWSGTVELSDGGTLTDLSGKIIREAGSYSLNDGILALDDAINNTVNNILVTGTADADEIINSGNNVTINALGGNDTITNSGSNNLYVYNNGDGTDVIQGLSGKNRLMINGELISLTTGENSTLTIKGGDSSAPTLNVSGNVTVNSMKNQTWEVEEGETFTYGSGSSAISLTPENTTAIITSDTYLNASVNVDGGAIVFAGAPANHTISFNERTISGAARSNATLTSVNDTLITANVDAQSSLSAGENGGTVNLATGATATITGDTSNTAITAVDSLAAYGSWILDDKIFIAQLGSDTVTFTAAGTSNSIRADSDGTKVSAIGFTTSNVTLQGVGSHSSVSVGVGTNWGISPYYSDDTFKAIFDTIGSISLGADTSAVVTLNNGGGSRNLAVGTNDSLTLQGRAAATLEGGLVTKVESLSSGGTWTVKGGSGERTVALGLPGSQDTISFARAGNENLYGVITAGLQGSKASIISDLSGFVSVTSASISGLQVVDNTWTLSGAVNSVAAFDSIGVNASVTSGNNEVFVGSENNATVAVTSTNNLMSGVFNGVTVKANDSDNLVGIELESGYDTVSANLAGITSLNSAATVNGDSLFTVNDTFTVQNLKNGTANTQFSVGSDSSAITIKSVKSGDAYFVTGGNVVYDINTGTALVSLNSAQVSVTAATTYGGVSNTHAVISGTSNDDRHGRQTQ